MLEAGNQFIVLKSFDSSTQAETGSYLASVVKEAQKLAHDKYGVHCNAVVTDNATNMISMGRIVEKGGANDDVDSETDYVYEEEDSEGIYDGVEEVEAPEIEMMGMFHSRCHAQITNLLLKDLHKALNIKTLVMDNILPVLKEFRKAGMAA